MARTDAANLIPSAPPGKAAKAAGPRRCYRCASPIAGKAARGAQHLKGTEASPQGDVCGPCCEEMVREAVAAALAAGTHSTAPAVRVCHGCRLWKPTYHRTPDGAELCYDCTPEGNR